jgi:hypothetical protein
MNEATGADNSPVFDFYRQEGDRCFPSGRGDPRHAPQEATIFSKKFLDKIYFMLLAK